MKLQWLVKFGCLCLMVAPFSGLEATPILGIPTFQEMGNDVKVTFGIKDVAVDARNDLPLCFKIELWEDDLIADELLGEFCLKITTDNSTQTLSNGWDKGNIMHTFKNASNAATGFGDDYYLEMTLIDCEDCEEVPEPATLLLLGASIPVAAWRRRRTRS